MVSASVHPQLVEKLKANEWAKAAAEAVGGKGGGKPNVAQGSGPKYQDTQKAIEAARNFASSKL